MTMSTQDEGIFVLRIVTSRLCIFLTHFYPRLIQKLIKKNRMKKANSSIENAILNHFFISVKVVAAIKKHITF